MRVIETRVVDELGRIVLPIELRKEFDIYEKSAVSICVNDENQILLRKCEPACKICGKAEDLRYLQEKGVFICKSCRSEISNL